MTLLGNNKLGLVRHWVALYDLMLDFSPRELFGDNTKFSETPGVVWCKYEEVTTLPAKAGSFPEHARRDRPRYALAAPSGPG